MTQKTRPPMNPLSILLIVSAVFFAVFLTISGALFLYKSPSSGSGSSASSSFFGEGSVGIVEMTGVILDSKKTLQRLEKFEEDDQIKAVVLRLNSPGGSVAPSQEIYEAVKSYKKPLVVSMASVAASGAYYIACGAKKVFANPGTITGSIGVIMEFANLQKLYEWAKIQRYALKTGKYKDAGADYKEMSAEERVLLQGMIDDVLKQFKEAVSKGRKLPLEAVTAIADGRIFSGSQAKEAHLVDELGTLKDAVLEAAKMAKIKGKPNVVYSEKQKRGILDFIMDDAASNESSNISKLRPGLLSHLIAILEGSPLGEKPAGLDFTPGIYWLWRGSQFSE